LAMGSQGIRNMAPDSSPSVPLRTEHRFLIALAVISAVLAVGVPLVLAPQRQTDLETRTTTHVESYFSTQTRIEITLFTTRYEYSYWTTSLFTTIRTVTYYVTTEYYTSMYYGPGSYPVTVTVPVEIRQIQLQATTIQRTGTIEQLQTATTTKRESVLQVTSFTETMSRTRTIPYSSAVVRSYGENLVWVALGVALPVLTYHRINGYRTRLHIYYEILNYTAYASRLPSHIMRACNLETGKFEKYVRTLSEKGFIDEVNEEGAKLYRASQKGRELIRNEKLAGFVKELP